MVPWVGGHAGSRRLVSWWRLHERHRRRTLWVWRLGEFPAPGCLRLPLGETGVTASAKAVTTPASLSTLPRHRRPEGVSARYTRLRAPRADAPLGRASDVMSRSALAWPARASGRGSACAPIPAQIRGAPRSPPLRCPSPRPQSVSLQFSFPRGQIANLHTGTLSSARPGNIKVANELPNLSSTGDFIVASL